MSTATDSRLRAMLRGRCPRCRRGPIFRGQLAMNERCPVCGLRFGREAGYYTGAMYISYALAVPLLAALTLLFWGLTDWPVERILLAATLALLPFVPAIFRYSRVIWIYLDRALAPDS